MNNLISNQITYISQSQRTHLTKSVNHSYFPTKTLKQRDYIIYTFLSIGSYNEQTQDH